MVWKYQTYIVFLVYILDYVVDESSSERLLDVTINNDPNVMCGFSVYFENFKKIIQLNSIASSNSFKLKSLPYNLIDLN